LLTVTGVSPIKGVLGIPFVKLLAVTTAAPDSAEPPGQTPTDTSPLPVNAIQFAWTVTAQVAVMISVAQRIRDILMVISPVKFLC